MNWPIEIFWGRVNGEAWERAVEKEQCNQVSASTGSIGDYLLICNATFATRRRLEIEVYTYNCYFSLLPDLKRRKKNQST